MKEIVVSSIAFEGNNYMHTIQRTNERDCGYAVEYNNVVRVWAGRGEETETTIYPLDRVVFVREVIRNE